MSKVIPLSPVQKERLMQRISGLRKICSSGMVDVVGFELMSTEHRVDIYIKIHQPGRKEMVFPITFYTGGDCRWL